MFISFWRFKVKSMNVYFCNKLKWDTHIKPFKVKFIIILFKNLPIFLICLITSKSYAIFNHTYIVGIEKNDLYPYFKQNEKGETVGYIRSVLDLFSKKENLKLNYEALPISRLFHEFLSEKSNIDFKFPDDLDWQKDLKKESGKTVFYSDPINKYKAGFFLRKDKISSKELVIGTIRGFTVPNIAGYNKNFTFQESNSLDILLKKLEANRIDGIYFDYNIINFNLNKKNISTIVFRKSLPILAGDYRLSSVKHKDFIDKFNQFIRNNKEEINKLKKKYSIEF